MNEILNELSKPVWWVSVVLAGIVINLFSSFLRGQINRTVLSTSTWWRRRSAARQKAWEERIERLSISEAAREFTKHSEIIQRLQSIHLLLLAIFMLILPLFLSISSAPLPRAVQITIFGFSGLIFFGSFLAFRGAISTRDALHEALKTN